MVEDLLRGFVHEDWLSWLDFTTLERVNGSFVTEGLKDRRNDVIWRIRWEEEGEGGWFYLYLLMEFQSTPDPFMAVRLLVYEGLLLQELIREGGLTASDRLPPILSIVFYNGQRPWKGPSIYRACSLPFRAACAGACRNWSTSCWTRTVSAGKRKSSPQTW